MKAVYIFAFLLLSASFLYGQKVKRQNPKKVAPNDTITVAKATMISNSRRSKK